MQSKAVIYELADFPFIKFLMAVIATIRNGNVEISTFKFKLNMPMMKMKTNNDPRPARPK